MLPSGMMCTIVAPGNCRWASTDSEIVEFLMVMTVSVPVSVLREQNPGQQQNWHGIERDGDDLEAVHSKM